MKKKAKKAKRVILPSQALTQTLQIQGRTATEKQFLENLSRWIIDNYGDVNVAQRLNILSNKLRKGPTDEKESTQDRKEKTAGQAPCGPYHP